MRGKAGYLEFLAMAGGWVPACLGLGLGYKRANGAPGRPRRSHRLNPAPGPARSRPAHRSAAPPGPPLSPAPAPPAGLVPRPGSNPGLLAYTDPGRPAIDTIDLRETRETITRQTGTDQGRKPRSWGYRSY